MKKEIILASGSPRRRELLNQIGIDFTVITSDADEITTEKSPEKIVMQLSSLKAEAVAKLPVKKKVQLRYKKVPQPLSVIAIVML